MFANRFTAVVDACSLVSTLRRNLLLTLAEAGFYRVAWSAQILDETERAIARLLETRGASGASAQANTARRAMEIAFAEAEIRDYDQLLPVTSGLPDPKDAHVLAAALKAEAAMIVTENLRDFPIAILRPLDLEAKSADAFIADTISLDPGRAVAAVRRLRERLRRPALDADGLLTLMEAAGLTETVDQLRPFSSSL